MSNVTATANFTVSLLDPRTRYGITDDGVVLDLYDFGVSVSSGVITGTQATDYDAAVITATHLGDGIYKFSSVPPGQYSVVFRGPGFLTQVVTSDDGFRVAPGENASQIAVSSSDRTPISEKLNEIIDFLQANSAVLTEGTMPTDVT